MKEIGDLTIYCIHCDKPFYKKMEEVENWQFMRCPSCNATFNINGVYDSFYEDIPIARKIVDILTTNIQEKYNITSNKPSEVDKIKAYLTKNNFQQLLTQIIHDMVIYGNAFLTKTDPLQRINPTRTNVETSFQRRPVERIGYSEEIDELRYDGHSVKYPEFIHFIGETSMHKPLAMSVYGYWLHTWYFLKYSADALIRMSFFREPATKDIDKIRSIEESGVIGAAGIPLYLIYPERVEDYAGAIFLQMEKRRFAYTVQRYQEGLARTIQEEIFPLALNREYEFDNYPKFTFEKT